MIYITYRDAYRKNNVSYWIEKECYSITGVTKQWLIADHLTHFGTELKLSLNDRINSRGDYIR